MEVIPNTIKNQIINILGDRMNKLLRMIPLFLISLTIVIFGIFEYVKYGFALFIFLIIVFFCNVITYKFYDRWNERY